MGFLRRVIALSLVILITPLVLASDFDFFVIWLAIGLVAGVIFHSFVAMVVAMLSFSTILAIFIDWMWGSTTK